MKKTAVILVAFSLLISCRLQGAEPTQTLAQDAAALVSATGTTWKSDVLDIRFADGSLDKRMLVMKFATVDRTNGNNAPQATVTLLIETPPQGVKGVFEASASFGASDAREVRLQETDGVRTITMRRGPESVGGAISKEKREQILNRSAISFPYQLKGDTLTLQGFPKGVTKWGSLEFTVPETDIKFKAVR
jgi:hypothetical protein